jgi:tRNA(fMet)-specific endonuclease VapC
VTRSAASASGLLDTSVVVHLYALRDPAALPDEPLISAVTLAELSLGPLVAADDVERAERQARLAETEASFSPLPFDAAAARAFGRVAASMRAAGRKPAARGFDALIAATALASGIPVYTTNAKDFDGIDGLTVVSVEVDRG